MVKAPLFTTERTYRRMRKKPVDTTYVHTIPTERYKVRGNIQAYCMIKATVLSLAPKWRFIWALKKFICSVWIVQTLMIKVDILQIITQQKKLQKPILTESRTRMHANTLTTKQIGEHIIDRSMEVYALLDSYAKKHNIHIYNATRGGNLEIFPRVKLEDVLSKKMEESK